MILHYNLFQIALKTTFQENSFDFCQENFFYRINFNFISILFSGEKPYKCPHCPSKAFSQSNDLVKHLRSHVGNNTYQCDICPMAFRLYNELKKHKLEHFQTQQKIIESTPHHTTNTWTL